MRSKYREIMDSLKNDLLDNEKECKKLQEQIEWVSRRRAELRDEVSYVENIYGLVLFQFKFLFRGVILLLFIFVV